MASPGDRGPTTSAESLPGVPEDGVRVFQGTRGDLDEYAITSLGTLDGRSRIEIWTVASEEQGEYDGEVFAVAEGDCVEFDGAVFTLVEADDGHDPPYVTLALA